MEKVWLITGSGSGLGRSIVEAALAAGDLVVAGARRLEELDALVEQYGERISPVMLEVRDEGAAKAAVQRAVDAYGRLDVLVNNAGYQYNAPFEQVTSEEFRDVIETCLFGIIYTTRAAVPVMRKQKGGHIFQVSSIGGRMTIPGNSPYHAAKWAVGGFSDSLADEVAPFGVKVCTLEPGGIRTNFKRRTGGKLPPEYEPSVGPVYKMMAAEHGSDPGLDLGHQSRAAGTALRGAGPCSLQGAGPAGVENANHLHYCAPVLTGRGLALTAGPSETSLN